MPDMNDIAKDLLGNGKEIYDDALKPAAQEAGKTLALIPQTINAALAPLRQWIEYREYNVAETKKLLENKLKNVGVDHIVSPEPYIAVPAIQSISYSMDSQELRDMYANLLARSMTDYDKDKVHPSFVEIIRQLTPDEAKLLKFFIADKSFPIIDVKCVVNDEGHFIEYIHNYTNIADEVCENPREVSAYIDNLSRLKIIEVTDKYFTDDNKYKPLEESELIKNILNMKLDEGKKWKIDRKLFDVTSYGREFIETCVIDKVNVVSMSNR